MDKVFGTVIVIGLISLALGFMFASWQRRRRRDVSILISSGVHPERKPVLEIRCLYVATTPQEEPLERLAIPGLAFRARARVSLGASGITLEPQGEQSTFIATTDVRRVRAANATIDRSAGPGSLTAIDWRAETGEELTSFLRIPRRHDRTAFTEAVNASVINPPTPSKEPAS